MIIEDFVMLGRTVPEESKKHGLVVCSAGYSRELRQFMRVYPIMMIDRVPKWSRCKIGLKRNPDDSRVESWRLQQDHGIEVAGAAKKSDEFDFLSSLKSSSIAELNDRRASLGIIRVGNVSWRFDGMQPNEEYLMSLFPSESGSEEKKKPRVLFSDDDGEHDLQIRDWGAHEFLRKNPGKHADLWGALKLTDKTYEHLLFVGNHNQHRSSWLVISIISEQTRPQLSLFDQEAA
jgi:hypothetical protein